MRTSLVEVDRADAVEPRRPRGRRELGAEGGRALVPDFVGRHSAHRSSVHRCVHRCGEPSIVRSTALSASQGQTRRMSPCRPGRAPEGSPGKFAAARPRPCEARQRSTERACATRGRGRGSRQPLVSGPRRTSRRVRVDSAARTLRSFAASRAAPLPRATRGHLEEACS